MAPQFDETRPGRGVRTIQGYAPGAFRIAGEQVAGAAFVTAARSGAWGVTALADLTVADFAPLFEEEGIEVVLLGTGATMARPPKDLAAALKARHGATLDFMDSRAAARTYNVLVAEGRRVAAALLPL